MDEASAPRATALAANVPAPGDVIADKYVVERIVGHGGMGVVLAARHLKLQQPVAIKLLTTRDGRQPEADTRLLREAQLSASLRSDHVVRVFDVGTLEDGSPFLVMELLIGRDIGELLDERGPFPVREAVEIVLQACDAIAEAHAAGIVHRDLKPSNLFMTERRDGTPMIKVLDFGISKLIRRHPVFEGTLTSTRTAMGSPFYMAPEQLRDAKSVDARCDIWGLGVILQELLTGEPAFPGDTLPAVCAAIVADPPRSIAEVRSDVPPALQDIVSLCLEKSPSARFQSVTDLMQALRPFGDARALRSAPPRAVTLTSSSGSFPVPKTDRRSAARISAFEAAATQASMSSSGLSAVARTSSRRALVVGVASVVALAAVVSVALALRPGAAPISPAALEPAGFTLRVESRPAGADVLEGERRLGATPLEVPVSGESVRGAPRIFTIRLDGYEPYVVRQGASGVDVRVDAVLIRRDTESPSVAPVSPLDSARPSAPEASAAAVTTRPVTGPARAKPPSGLRPARPTAPASGPAPAPSEPDIRLVR